jgi:phage-related protein
MELFKLFGTIAIDNSEANEALDDTSEKASGAMEKLSAGIGTAAKWGTAIVGASTVASSAMVGFASNSASAADEIDKMSAKIGISKQGYQEWSYVMGQNGADVNSLQMGMKTLITQMDKAADGTEESMEMFDALGVSIYDANGNLKDQETMMNEVMYALADMENGTEKAKLANDLFGKSGSELMPMLNQGSQAMKDLTDRSHELGLIMSDDTVNAGVALGDIMDDVKQSVGMLGTKLGTSLFPILQKVCELVIANLPMIQGLFDKLAPVVTTLLEGLLPPLMELVGTILPVIIDFIAELLPPLVEIVSAVLPIIVELFEAIMPLLQLVLELLSPLIDLVTSLIVPIIELASAAITPLIEVFKTLIQAVLTPLQPILDTLCNTLGTILTPIIETLAPVIQTVSSVLQPLMDLFSGFINVILTPIIPLIETVANVLGTTLGGAFTALSGIVEEIMGVFGGLIDFLTGVFTLNWEQAWNGIVDVFKGIFNLIPTAIETIINAAIGLINGIITGVNNVTGWVGIPEIPYIPTVTIPKLEKGGILEEGQVGLLEGNGAEAVVPLDQNHAWISKVAADMRSHGIGGDSDLMSKIFDKLDEVHELLAFNLPMMARMQVCLDTGALIGELAPGMDEALGELAIMGERGV